MDLHGSDGEQQWQHYPGAEPDGQLLDHLSKYQAVVATGGPLYRSVAERFFDTFKVPIRCCYGVTEVGGSITFQSWEDALAFERRLKAA